MLAKGRELLATGWQAKPHSASLQHNACSAEIKQEATAEREQNIASIPTTNSARSLSAMFERLTQTQPSEREKAAVKEFFGSQTESYTDADATFSEEETRDDGASFITDKSDTNEKSGGDTQVREVESDDSAPDENVTPDENAPAPAPKNFPRSPTGLMSKLKPFSPRSLVTSPKKKSNHFFSESPKSKPSPKMPVIQKVLSPRSPRSPKQSAAVAKKSVEERVSLAVAPGRLGLSLKIDKQRGGAMIMSVHPRCAFFGKVDVGDHIVYIDDRKVKTLQDFKVGIDKNRNFIVRRNKKTPEPSNISLSSPSSKVSAVTEPEVDTTTTPAEASLADDLSQQFSLVEMNTSLADEKLAEGGVTLESPAPSCEGSEDDAKDDPTDIEENSELKECEAKKVPCAFNCAEGNSGIIGGFYTNKFSCAKSVASESNSSIKTFLKPITKLMECGQAEAADYAIYSGDFEIEPAVKMSDEVPSIAEISELQIGDHAFIKRSNGEWTYSIVLEVGKDSISFSVDDFGNGKTITKHRWLSSIRLVTTSVDDDFESTVADTVADTMADTIAEEYTTSLSSSGSEDHSTVASSIANSKTTPTVDRKAELKAMLDKKKMDLKATKQNKKKEAKKAKAAAAEAKRKLKAKQEQVKKMKKKQAKEAAAEAKRQVRELKAQKELEAKLRLMQLEEQKIKNEAEAERERQRMKEEKRAKKMQLEELRLEKEEKAERARLRAKEEKKAKKMTELKEKKKKKQAKEEGKVEMKMLQKARKQAAALEAQRQADLLFKNFDDDTRDANDATAKVQDEVSKLVDEFFLCEM